jgi:hypothetical protein
MDWRTTYPTLATVNEAAWQTLDTWARDLPPPTTDVERTIARRIRVQLGARVGDAVRQAGAPEIASAWNDIIDKLEKAGIKHDAMGRM